MADTLEELWMSYNPVDKLRGIGSLKKLTVLYMANNNVKEWVEFNRLQVRTSHYTTNIFRILLLFNYYIKSNHYFSV